MRVRPISTGKFTAKALQSIAGRKVDLGVTQRGSLKFLMEHLKLSEAAARKLLGGKA